MNWLDVPAFLFKEVAKIRGTLYDHGWFKSYDVPCPVISVGNITVGGTGKTPFSIWLMERFLSQGLNVGFVSRGYKSGAGGVRPVTKADAALFGDEPSLVRLRFPLMPIYVGPERTAAALRLFQDAPVDVIIADDAFQHRKMRRDLDLVLLDALEPEWHYDFLPKGRAREDFSSLERAKFVVISKHNLASQAQLEFLRSKLDSFKGSRLFMNYKCGGFSRAGKMEPELRGTKFLVTGVGRPESVTRLLSGPVLQHKIFDDHHDYTQIDAESIMLEFRQSGAQHFVTTGKDAVKLDKLKATAGELWKIELKIDVEGDLDELDHETDRLVCGIGLAWVLIHIPRTIRDGIGSVLGLLWYDVFRIRRVVVFNNLGIAFPEMSAHQKIQLGRRSLTHLGKCLVEYSFLPFLKAATVENLFEFEGLELIDQASKEGRGALLLTCHLGNGDLASAGLALLGYKLYMVSKFFKLKWLNDLWFGMRRRAGVDFIPARNSSFAFLKALKTGGLVILPLDQFTGPPIGVRTKFFGRETGTAAGMAVMAERANSPVIACYTWRLPNGKHKLKFTERIDVHFTGDRDLGIVDFTQRFNDTLETFIRLHPDQWMWIHRRWKEFRV